MSEVATAQHFWGLSPDTHVALGTYGLFLATAVLAVFTYRLFSATVRMNAAAVRAAATQEDMTRRSLEIAERALRTNERASRPFLMPEIVSTSSLYSNKPTGFKPTVGFAWANYGKSPALLRRASWKLALQRAPGVAVTDASFTVSTSLAVIQDGGRSPPMEAAHRKLEAADVDRTTIDNQDPQSLRFFLVGVVEYDDLFGHRYLRTFCVKLFRNSTYNFKINEEHQTALAGTEEQDDVQESVTTS